MGESRIAMETDTQRIARALFKKAITVNKKHSASWVSWANFEQRLGNRGSFSFWLAVFYIYFS